MARGWRRAAALPMTPTRPGASSVRRATTVRQPGHEAVEARVAGLVVEDRDGDDRRRGGVSAPHPDERQRPSAAADAGQPGPRPAEPGGGRPGRRPAPRVGGAGVGRRWPARRSVVRREPSRPAPGNGTRAWAASARTAGSRRCRRARCAPGPGSRPGRGRSPRGCARPRSPPAAPRASPPHRPGQQQRQRPRRLRLEPHRSPLAGQLQGAAIET